MPRKKKEGPRMTSKVFIKIENGLITDVTAPKTVSVVIKDYDIRDWHFTDSEVKTDKDGKKYMEEIWEGADV